MATRLNQRHTTIHNAAHSLRRTPETPRLRLVSGVESDTTNSAQAGRSLHRRKLAESMPRVVHERSDLGYNPRVLLAQTELNAPAPTSLPTAELLHTRNKSWRLCQLSANTASAIHSALRCERKPLPTTLDALTAECMYAGRDTTGADPPPRRLDVSPSMHGHRKMLYHSLGSRSKSWANNIYHGRRQVPQVYYDGASPPPSACDSAIESELRPATSGLPRVQRGWPTELGESPGGRCSLHRGLVPAQSRLEESGTTNSVEAEGRTATLSRPYGCGDLEAVRGRTPQFLRLKNHHRGETVGRKASGHPTASPTVAISTQLCHLRAHGATPSSPLCALKEGTSWLVVTVTTITALLREAVAASPECDITPADVLARTRRHGHALLAATEVFASEASENRCCCSGAGRTVLAGRMATRLNQRHTTIHNAAHSLRRTPETPRLRLVSGVESDTTNSAQAGRSLHRRKPVARSARPSSPRVRGGAERQSVWSTPLPGTLPPRGPGTTSGLSKIARTPTSP
ncbi:hypothetical protein THAOC_30162, partial [Thalassiosira oceanica]